MQRQPEPEYMDIADEAAAYAAADFSEVNEAFATRLIELAGSRPRARVLDLGTGPADIPVRLVQRRPDWHITAVDASPAMLDIAAQAVANSGLGGRIDLVLGDAKSLDLPAGRFDVVFSNAALHHINDVDALWAEVRRLAADGAAIFLRDLARPTDEQEAQRIVGQYASQEPPLLQEEFYRSLLAAYTVEEVRRQLQRAGFTDLHVARPTDRHLDVFGILA